MRIIHHPVLGDMPERKKVIIKVDGAEVEAYEGEPVAAALMAAGIKVFRKTRKRDEPRRIFCAVGRCTDCVMTVDGQPNVRTCVTTVRAGMEIQTQRDTSISRE
jgi:predicted molibdopterin-dependent oxidoreductase YjgC